MTLLKRVHVFLYGVCDAWINHYLQGMLKCNELDVHCYFYLEKNHSFLPVT